MRLQKLLVFGVAIVGLFLLFGCAGGAKSPTPASPTPEPKTATVEILAGAYNYDDNPTNDYSPSELRVHHGTTVTWVNKDSVPHTVTQHDGFDSGFIGPGKSWSYTFDKEGVYKYFCTLHLHDGNPWMKGKVIVEHEDHDHHEDDHHDGHDNHEHEDDHHHDNHEHEEK